MSTHAVSAPRDGAYVKYVSGKHALLTAVDGGVEVACTASLGGQWLRIGDGARVRRGGSTTARAGDIIHLGAGVPGGAAVEGFPPIAFRLALVPRDAALEVERGVPDAVVGGAAAADAPCVLFRAEGQSVTVRGAASSLRTALIASAIAGAGFDVTAWVSEGRAAISGDALRGAPFGGRHERAYRAAAVRLNLIGEGYSVRSSFMVGQTVQLRGNGVCTYSSPEQCTHFPRHVWKVKSRKRERSPSPQGGGGGGGGGSGGGRGGSSSSSRDGWRCSKCAFLNFAFRAECMKCVGAGRRPSKRQQRVAGGNPDAEECRDFRSRRGCPRAECCFRH